MPLLGAHMSIAGGYARAVEAAARCGMDVVQLFTKNNNQWRAKAISEQEAADFHERLLTLGITRPLSHSSYLLNLASPDGTLRDKSIAACVVELQRAEQLGIRHVVLHPGAHMGSGEEAGIANIVGSLQTVLVQSHGLACGILLETTAGQGSSLGHRFEHLAAILDATAAPGRLGVCLDTCHLFAAGYPLQSRRDYLRTIRELDERIGCERVLAIHLNDSKREMGSRVDRHEHIGRGKLGLEPFRHFLNDRRFRDVPMYLETAKGLEGGEDLDVINLRTLRGLIQPTRRRRV
ncbi:MAG: deoxyribonuclease IV [Pirellulaceae bacterium]